MIVINLCHRNGTIVGTHYDVHHQCTCLNNTFRILFIFTSGINKYLSNLTTSHKTISF